MPLQYLKFKPKISIQSLLSGDAHYFTLAEPSAHTEWVMKVIPFNNSLYVIKEHSIIKINANLEAEWGIRLNNLSFVFKDAVVDANGDCYAMWANYNDAIVKVTPDGNVSWIKTRGTSSTAQNISLSLANDVILSSRTSASSGQDIFSSALVNKSTGNHEALSFPVHGEALSFAADGATFCAAMTRAGFSGAKASCITISKYNSSGSTDWVVSKRLTNYTISTNLGSSYVDHVLTSYNQEHVYVTWVWNSTTAAHYYIWKLNASTGAIVWELRNSNTYGNIRAVVDDSEFLYIDTGGSILRINADTGTRASARLFAAGAEGGRVGSVPLYTPTLTSDNNYIYSSYGRDFVAVKKSQFDGPSSLVFPRLDLRFNLPQAWSSTDVLADFSNDPSIITTGSTTTASHTALLLPFDTANFVTNIAI